MEKKQRTTAQTVGRIAKIVAVIAIAVVLVFVTIRLLPWFVSLKDESVRVAFQEYVHSLGFGGVLLLLGIQVLQIVVAFLPGEPIEILGGMLYGTFGGLVLCLTGVLIGSCAVYSLVRLLGKPLIDRLFKKEEVSKYAFLRDTAKIETMVFILFFIPGTPKDILTYLAPFVRIKPLKFFLIATFARIPSVITSTYAGASIMAGKWWQTVVVFVITGILGLLGIWYNNRLTKKQNAKLAQEGEGAQAEKEETGDDL